MSWAEWADAVEIEPSIYASDFSRLGEQLGSLRAAGAKVFHFDVGDGHFIPEITIGPVVAASIAPLMRGWSAWLDCHLMVSEPEKHFEADREGRRRQRHVPCRGRATSPHGRSLTRARSASASASRSIRRRRSRRPSSRRTVPTSSSACRSIPATRARRSCPRRSIGSLRSARRFRPVCDSRWTAASTPRRLAPRETLAPISSSPAARSSGTTIPAAAYTELVGLVTEPRACLTSSSSFAIRTTRSSGSRSGCAATSFFAARGDGLVADVYLGYGLSQVDSPRRVALAARAVSRAPSRRLQDRGEPRDQVTRASQGLRRSVSGSARGTAAEYRDAIEDVRAGDRAGRRVPGERRPASRRAVRGRPARAGSAARAAAPAPSRSVRDRGLGGRVRLAGAVPRPPWRPGLDDADQGHPPARRVCRATCVREGRGRARDDRRPRAERSLARLRARHRPLAGAHGHAGARRRRAHGVDGGGNAPRRCRSGRDPARDVSRRLRDGRAEDRGGRPDRRARGRLAAAPRWARIGRIHGNGDFDLALTIRTFAIADGTIHLWVGGGIVWDSDPATEVEESWVKARPLLAAIGSRLPEAALA